jgi:hypothetical protein
MAVEDWSAVVALMRDRGIAFDGGLTDAEVEEVEARFGFRFPEDLRAFLQTALPRGEGFPDWPRGSRTVPTTSTSGRASYPTN